MISVQTNMTAWYANRQFQLNKKDNVKSTEKLSSGYRINRAADDAAGLAISEKMRKRIRGLAQGSKNGQDGVSWTQIGDGALNEADDILHRMTELTIKSLNGTNTNEDRLSMDAEFEQLKLELDRISNTTEFNTLNIFEEHDTTYYQCEGGASWASDQLHAVTAGQNEITFEYRAAADDAPQTVTFTVPPGEYTTMELLDELEEVLPADNGDGSRFVLDYNEGGFINVNLEGGEAIDSITGSLSYLIYDMYKGGSLGALIGTTVFPEEDSTLLVKKGMNDELYFDVQYLDPNAKPVPVKVELPTGASGMQTYTRDKLMGEINRQVAEQLGAPDVQASASGTGIKLGSDKAIVTGFSGNMFKIDVINDPDKDRIYHSVFYDNIMYGNVEQWDAYYEGGYVLTTDSRDVEHSLIKIAEGVNDVLRFVDPNSKEGTHVLKFDPDPDGDGYTLEEIARKMNDFFKDNGIAVKASVKEYTTRGVTDSEDKTMEVIFKGLRLESQIEGPNSKIGLDTTSSAYETLFETRDFNHYGERADVKNDNRSDSNAALTGGRSFSSLSSSQPLSIIEGQNNEIILTVKDNKGAAPYSTTNNVTTDKIQLTPTTVYTSMSDLLRDINTAINNSKFKGKIIAEADYANRILLRGVDGQYVNEIRVDSNCNSYKTLFWTQTKSYTPQINNGYGQITIPTGGANHTGPMEITLGNKTLPVTLPDDRSKIPEAIEAVFPASAEEKVNDFGSASGQGSSHPRTVSGTGQGTSRVEPWSGSAKGDSKDKQGLVGYEYNNPAVLMGPELKDNMNITADNNELLLTLNGRTEKLVLAEGPCANAEELAARVQSAINEVFKVKDKEFGGAVVSVENNRLVFTANLPEGYNGKDTNISCSSDNSSLLRYLRSTEEGAKCVSNLPLAPEITINGTNNHLKFMYSTDGGQNYDPVDIWITPSGTYSPETMAQKLDRMLSSKGFSADVVNGKLEIASKATGPNVMIKYDSNDGGNSAEALFGNLSGEVPAVAVIGMPLQDPIHINAGERLPITVNGDSSLAIEFPVTGDYSPSGFVNMLKERMQKQGIEAEAFLTGGCLGFRTNKKGDSANLYIAYDKNNEAMKSIWGSTKEVTPGIDAKWEGDNLVLRVVDEKGNTMNNKLLSVSSATGGGLQPMKENIYTYYETPDDGYHSTIFSYMDGVNLDGDVEIDEWSDEMTFVYKDNGTEKDVSIAFTEDEYGSYNYDQLAEILQRKLDNSVLGKDKIKVTVDANGVRMQSVNVGNNYQFGQKKLGTGIEPVADGDFYWKVMCGCDERVTQEKPSVRDPGGQNVSSIYIVGRKDVKSKPVEINQGVNDRLTLKVTFGDDPETPEDEGDRVLNIDVTIDQGRYNSDELKEHLQGKIDEWLTKEGFDPGAIVVGVGGPEINTGVVGANDDVALNFRLSKDVQSPYEGPCVIDSVGGSAAFSIFYQTDGELIPAYITGTKDVTDGVTINDGDPEEATLTFDVDGQEYSVTFDPTGYYSKEGLIDKLNEMFSDPTNGPVPLVASTDIDTGRVKISYNQLGEHEIRKVSGGAKNEVFFAENGDTDETVRFLQMSDVADDTIELSRNEFSTAKIGIHSVCITKPKYANKALTRLETALKMISDIRSNFGSTQNRIEHAINNNKNMEENTQAAESLLRDLDMSKQMVANANQNILLQVGQAMMSQAQKSNEIILSLLR